MFEFDYSSSFRSLSWFHYISFCISGTPSPGDDLEKQRPRRKRSAQDTKRRLALENYEKKRREGLLALKKKVLPEENESSPNYDASPDSCHDEYTSQLISESDNKSDEEDLEVQ